MKPTFCKTCGSAIPRPAGAAGRPPTVCSRECRNAHYRAEYRKRNPSRRRVCKQCSEPIEGRRNDAVFCAEKCRLEFNARHREGRAPKRGPRERFWSSVSVDKETGCWNWTGALLRSGYGSMRVNDVGVVTHRYAWEILRGPIPAGLQVDHLCFNRRCCNPSHLEPVTQQENLRRARARKVSA